MQGQRSQWQQFFASLEEFIALEKPWTLVLSDPLANTFVAPCTEDLADDPRLRMEVSLDCCRLIFMVLLLPGTGACCLDLR